MQGNGICVKLTHLAPAHCQYQYNNEWVHCALRFCSDILPKVQPEATKINQLNIFAFLVVLYIVSQKGG